MDNDTIYYVAGTVLVLMALGTAMAALRFERFPPSRAVQLAGITAFALLVGVTTTFAWRNATDEQAQRQREQAEGKLPTPAETKEAIATGQESGEQATTTTTGGGGTTTTTASVSGAELFDQEGCSGCHTLKAANATGTTGPDLDTALKGKSAGFIETSIVDPNAVVEKGYPPNVMPQTFGKTLSPQEIEALVKYLQDSVK